MAGLADSIREDGWIGAITAACDGETFDGSARLEQAAEVLGVEVQPIVVETDGTRPVIVVRTDIATAADMRARRLGLAANRVAQLNLHWAVDELVTFPADALGRWWEPEEISALGEEWLGTQGRHDAREEQAQAVADRGDQPMVTIRLQVPADVREAYRQALGVMPGGTTSERFAALVTHAMRHVAEAEATTGG